MENNHSPSSFDAPETEAVALWKTFGMHGQTDDPKNIMHPVPLGGTVIKTLTANSCQ